MYRLPSLNALKAFEAASRHLSFKAAAEELHVTQSAIAQQIRGLEEELGLKLFERHPKGIVLSNNGRFFAQSIEQAFHLIHEATQTLQQQPQHLTISVTPTFASKWLIPRLNDFRQRYPDIDLQILATERLSHFQHDAVDIAIRYGKPPFGSGLNTELLLKDSFIAVANPQLFASGQLDNILLQDLEQYTLLHDANNLWTDFLNKLKLKNHHAQFKKIRFNQTLLAIDAAIAGQGIALTNPIFIESELNSQRLIRVFNEELVTDTGFYLVYPRRPENFDKILNIREWLFAQMALTTRT